MSNAVNSWQMADVVLTGVQALFAFIGTVGLVISLWFTKKALDLSRRAIEDQARYTRSELAAYISTISFQRIIGDDLRLVILLQNVGQTPALRVRGDVRAGLGPREHVPMTLLLNGAMEMADLPPNQTFEMSAGPVLTLEQVDDLISPDGLTAMYFYGWVAWDDVFDHRRAVPFCVAMFGPSLVHTEAITDYSLDMLPPEERPFAPKPRPSGRTGRFRTPI